MAATVSALSPNFSLRRSVRKPTVRGRGGIVVTQNRVASEAGARVLAAGGHAVDAAVAAAFAVGVVEPWMSGIGGVGAMLVYEAGTGRITGIDFGARSPKSLDPKDFRLTDQRDEGNLFGWPKVAGSINTVGAKAVVAPTMPAGLAHAHRRFGRKAWRDLLAPAIGIAEEGMTVDWHTTLVIATAMADLARDPAARARFLPTGCPPVAPAAVEPNPVKRLPMPDLARTLRAIAEDGADVLYTGALARRIADDVKEMGGYLGTEDLATVRPREVEPLTIGYFDRAIHVLPELNGGPTLWVAFHELLRRRKTPEAAPEAKTFLAYADALRVAWQDRFERMGDAGGRGAPTCTTHICVVDGAGNMVTLTQTLLSVFGARIVLPRTGILMNNGINWFDPVPGRPNSIAPDRAGLANYVPAIMTGGDDTTAIGGCGGRRILPAVFQLLAMSADFGFDLEQAFHQPRIDVSGLDVVVADRRMAAETVAALAARFATVVAEPVEYPFPYTIAGAVRRKGGMNEGATEPQHPWSEAVAEDG
ncbi:MAG: gamma-glutamyltransferase [Hyphomicrobiaceae bacterium]|nr:MAG: gamma-glutamyltransferase [Hyphomicrobiaceae bacterium]